MKKAQVYLGFFIVCDVVSIPATQSIYLLATL
jgi:hypothetical protein